MTFSKMAKEEVGGRRERDQQEKEKQEKEKQEKEKTLVTNMIIMYCKGNRHGSNAPCSECTELIDYANDRTDNCPVMETKTFCSKCTVHCYNPEMREKIKTVMRYSGPRLLFHNPVMAVKYVIADKQGSFLRRR